MPQRQKKKRQKRKSNHVNKTKQSKNNTDKSTKELHTHNDYEGRLFISETICFYGDNLCAYWGILRGSVLYIYPTDNKNLNDSAVSPYDVIDISEYCDMSYGRYNHLQAPYALYLKGKSLAIVECRLYFDDINYCKKWMQLLQKIIEYNKTSIEKSTQTNSIFAAWTVINKNVGFMELRPNDSLFIFNNNLANRKKIKTIKLKDFQYISVCDQKESTLFKYGFELKNKENISLLFTFKINNYRHEFVTHIDYIINKKLNTKNNKQFQKIDEKKQSDINYMQSIKIIKYVLKLYGQWKSNTNNNISLQSFLQQNTKCSFVDILNSFHCILTVGQKNEFYGCNAAPNTCEFISRHRTRNINSEHDVMSELLDKIHCYMCHSEADNEFVAREDICSKYVMETQNNDTEDADEKDNKNVSSIFLFGVFFDYYSNTTFNHIIPHFTCLKKELIANPYYKITIDKYYNLYQQALIMKKSKTFTNLKCIPFEEESAQRTATRPLAPISMNHIISLLIYCNETKMQYVLKKHTRKNKKTELFESLRARQSFVAHWTRYLYESCIMYGEKMKKDEFVYSGVDAKLIFDSFSFSNHCPLSTTSDLTVANNFATNQGLIMKLKPLNDTPFNCQYFDMVLLSDYPREKEKFFSGHAELKITDLIFDGDSHKIQVSALRLLELIMKGSLFYFKWNEDLYSEESQNMLIKLLKRYIQKIDEDYFDQLTRSVIESFLYRDELDFRYGIKMILLNQSQLSKLKDSVKTYFEVILFLSNRFQETLKKAVNTHHIQWLRYLRIHCSDGIPTIYINEQHLKQSRFKIGDHIYNDGYNNGYKFDFFLCKKFVGTQMYWCIIIEEKTLHEKGVSIKISYDIVCEEINWQYIDRVAKLSKANEYSNMAIAFPCAKVARLNEFTIDLNVKIVCFL